MTVQVKRIRIPLRHGTRVSDVEQAFSNVGFSFGIRHEESDAGPAELIWTTDHRNTTVHLIDDRYINRLYVVARGPRAGDAAKIIRECSFSLTANEILRELDATKVGDADYPELVTSLALVTQDRVDEETVSQLRKSLAHRSPSVRIRILEALSYTDDPAYRLLAKEVLQQDTDEQVRRTASALLDAYETIHEP